jgi:anthranilate phosphoribosyltransferase
MIPALLRELVAGRRPSPADLETVLAAAMQGTADPVALGGLLAALAMVPVDGALLAAGARALRRHANAVRPRVRPLVDTCGTGGDGSGTFNVSTAAAMVVAAAGCAVAKHGNRGVSSPVGSADVLEQLGVRLELDAARAQTALDATGFVFLFAPAFHPAMRHVAPVRKALGVRTLFNLLGPLCNPAGADHQLLGVYDAALTLPMAAALRELGSRAALVVHCMGVDELGLHGPTIGHRLIGDRIEPFALEPASLGLLHQPIEALRGGDRAENARLLRQAILGTGGPHSDIVALNAGAALWVAGAAADIAAGLLQARACMQSGAANAVLDRYVATTQRLAGAVA